MWRQVSLAEDIEPLGRSLYEPKSFWPDERGAARLGVQLCELAIALGQGPTFEDACQLLLVSHRQVVEPVQEPEAPVSRATRSSSLRLHDCRGARLRCCA